MPGDEHEPNMIPQPRHRGRWCWDHRGDPSPWNDLILFTDSPLVGLPPTPVRVVTVWGVLLRTVAPFPLVLGSMRRIGASARRRVGAQRAGIVATTEPFWAALIAIFVLGNAVT